MDVTPRPIAASSHPPLIARRNLHRATFIAAGVYNIVWGLTTGLYPQWLYRLTGGATHDRAEMASALGLVIGLYGVLYLEVARVPERGALIAAVGLAGKVIGPVGLLILIQNGTWPASSLLISATNDFIWWLPFALYLYDWRAAAINTRDADNNAFGFGKSRQQKGRTA